MTQTQKRWIEIPVLLIVLWVVQALEMTLFRLPYFLGAPQFISILIAYIAYTRGWNTVTILSFVFSFMASANVGFSTGVFVAAHMWAALITKGVVMAMTLEGRRAFVGLVVGYSLLLRGLTYALLQYANAGPTLPSFFAQILVQTAIFAVLAWILYWPFSFWDGFFGHLEEEEHSRGVRARILR
jgi:hypothetical protein